MRPAAYTVDLDLLVDTIATLTAAERRCDDALDVVATRVERLHVSWSGRAAVAQDAAQARWEAGFARMVEGLAAMRTAAQTADRNYRAAVDGNVRLWAL